MQASGAPGEKVLLRFRIVLCQKVEFARRKGVQLVCRGLQGSVRLLVSVEASDLRPGVASATFFRRACSLMGPSRTALSAGRSRLGQTRRDSASQGGTGEAARLHTAVSACAAIAVVPPQKCPRRLVEAGLHVFRCPLVRHRRHHHARSRSFRDAGRSNGASPVKSGCMTRPRAEKGRVIGWRSNADRRRKRE